MSIVAAATASSVGQKLTKLLQEIVLVLKQFRHLGIHLALGEKLSDTRSGFFVSLFFLIILQDVQKLLVHFWLLLKAVLDFVHIIDGVIKFNGRRARL